MHIKPGVVMAGLHPCMRVVQKEAERIWNDLGQGEGVTITSALDGEHGPGSWHPCGCALDLRTRYFDEYDECAAADQLREALPGYDVVVESTHIHVEVGDALAKQWGLLL